MKRVAILLITLVGCQPPDERQPILDQPALPVAPPPATATTAGIEFANWPTATRFPIDVSPAVAYACGPGVIGAESRWAKFGSDKRHGPHLGHSIVVRVNPDAEQEFKRLAAPLPVGTVVVKEKHGGRSPSPKGPPNEYGAMIKREAGYDPEHGDWEYLYVLREPEERVTRGRLGSCIDCHSHVKQRDYVFRTYLKADGVSEW